MNYISIGVDPGSSTGAIAVISDGNLRIYGMARKTEKQISEAFHGVLLEKGISTQVFGVIERVSAMAGQGVTSTFRFGTNYGFLRGSLVAYGIPFRDFLPKQWQKHYSMTRKENESTPVWKERLLNVAQNLYPGSTIPVYAADAVLLAHLAHDLMIKE